LAGDGKILYIADSEASSIRSVELAENGTTHTLAGSGDLFGFGRTDGSATVARFQHPLGLSLDGNVLYVADTFNNLIRAVDIKTGATSTIGGTGDKDPGSEEAIGFYEPGGLSVAGNILYIADTNHHRIVSFDIKTKKGKVLIGGK
jgi:sugar lactone lactonase YvrE